MLEIVPKKFDAQLEKIQVLAAVDSPQLIDLLKTIFSNLGFTQVFRAPSIHETLSIMQEVRIHLLVVDWELKTSSVPPEDELRASLEYARPVSGCEFVRRLRHAASSPNPYIPVLMLASQVSGKESILARDSGVNGIILKPLEAIQLCNAMRQAIEKPRIFVTAPTYRGPCRRRQQSGAMKHVPERRKRDIRVVRYQHGKSA